MEYKKASAWDQQCIRGLYSKLNSVIRKQQLNVFLLVQKLKEEAVLNLASKIKGGSNYPSNLTYRSVGTIYPSQHFPFGAAFVCQAGNFWTLLRIIYMEPKINEIKNKVKYDKRIKDRNVSIGEDFVVYIHVSACDNSTGVFGFKAIVSQEAKICGNKRTPLTFRNLASYV